MLMLLEAIAYQLLKVIIIKMCHESCQIAGIAVGNGFTDPITILDYSHFVYQWGLVDTNAYNDMKLVEEAGKTAIQEGRLIDAFLVCTTNHNLTYSLPGIRSSMSVTFLCLRHH
jgi:hypothetical protein